MEESFNVNLSACRFCDLMGLHLQVGIIAASFPFRSLMSIELDEELASGAWTKWAASTFGKKSCPVAYEVGFFKVRGLQLSSHGSAYIMITSLLFV